MNVLEKILEEKEMEVIKELIEENEKCCNQCEGACSSIKNGICNCGDGVLVQAIQKMQDFLESKKNENDDWIPCSKQLPEQERWVLATVMHSAWVSDYDSKRVKEEEKIHHQKSFETYLAHMNTFGKWIFLDENDEVTCDKEIGNDPGKIYNVVIAWRPLPEPYRAADSKPDWKENMLNTFLAGH